MTGMRSVATITAVVCAALLALASAGCRPMYGPTALGSNTTGELATVDVSTIPGRVGQRIRNDLVFLFTGGGDASVPHYRLEISYRESVAGVLFKRTEDASGMIYSLDAEYALKSLDGKVELTKGRSHARAAFDKNTSTFSNVRAQVDAENRAAKDIAADINTKIAAYISSNR